MAALIKCNQRASLCSAWTWGSPGFSLLGFQESHEGVRCRGSWWSVTGRQLLPLGGKSQCPWIVPLARQQHLSADLGTGMDLLGGVDALLV